MSDNDDGSFEFLSHVVKDANHCHGTHAIESGGRFIRQNHRSQRNLTIGTKAIKIIRSLVATCTTVYASFLLSVYSKQIPSLCMVPLRKNCSCQILCCQFRCNKCFENYKQEETCNSIHGKRLNQPVYHPCYNQSFWILSYLFYTLRNQLSSSLDKS